MKLIEALNSVAEAFVAGVIDRDTALQTITDARHALELLERLVRCDATQHGITVDQNTGMILHDEVIRRVEQSPQRIVRIGDTQLRLRRVQRLEDMPVALCYYESDGLSIPYETRDELGEVHLPRYTPSQDMRQWRSAETPTITSFENFNTRRANTPGDTSCSAVETPPSGIYLRSTENQWVRVELPNVSSDFHHTTACHHGSLITCQSSQKSVARNLRPCQFVHYGEKYSTAPKSYNGAVVFGDPQLVSDHAMRVSEDFIRQTINDGLGSLICGVLAAENRCDGARFVITEPAVRCATLGGDVKRPFD